MPTKFTPHRTRNPRRCDRCKPRRVEAEWNMKHNDEALQYLCGPHARYWAGVHDAPLPAAR